MMNFEAIMLARGESRLNGSTSLPSRGLSRLVVSFVALLASSLLHATHLRAGEILYERIGTDPSVHRYRVHVFTYVMVSSGVPDPEIEFNWGDGTVVNLPLTDTTPVAVDTDQREYIGEHTYAGPGTFVLTTEIQFRHSSVLTIPNSVNVPLSLATTLVIAPVIQPDNNSVYFQTLPLQDACLNELWEYNPAAVDPDGDSLAFFTITCLGTNGLPVPDYMFPDEVAPGSFDYSIDPMTGTITWNTPEALGVYNLAFVVKEYRNGNLIGSVLRDMQVTVFPCDNEPPVVSAIDQICVTAGTSLVFNVTATDPDAADDISLTAVGAPFAVDVSPANFTEPFPANPVTGIFSWQTECAHVRLAPYLAVFRGEDNGDVHLVDYHTTAITIVAPAPQNPTATPDGSAIDLAWDPSVCTNAVGYRVYRRNGSYGFTPANCETGVPAYTGYQLISGSDCIPSNSFTDNSALVFGQEYCYMVVACFPDGAQSYASIEFCALLDRQVPVITKVSVGITDVAAGVDTVQWSNAYDLDTVQHPGPYQFRVYRGENFTTATTLAHISTLWPTIDHPDTSFIDTNIDTRTDPQVYRVELYGEGGDTLIGESNVASSLFLVPEPNDEQITLHFDHSTPWVNSLYEVFRFDGLAWVFIGSSTTDTYVDTGLVNGVEYCYYAISTGAYSDPAITAPLRNWSQEVCSIPVDLTPPCPPTLWIDNDCEEPLNTLTWTNPNNSCADDTYQYNIWYQDSLGGEFTLIATITGAEDTTITHVNGSSVSGCYAVTAIDTSGNESAYGNVVCGDNCPEYALPNVFTPNGDQSNEFFTPFPYRGVKRIDLQVFNRWGQLVFTATDPDIGWNGNWQDSNEPATDGVYFYTCTVIFARLAGEEVEQLNGYVHILRGSSATPH